MLPRAPPAPSNKRRYPRAAVRIKARLSLGTDRARQFEATLNTRDLSVGGIFFESTFFLKMGQVVDVELELPPRNRLVRARGKVVRHETRNDRGREQGGFAINFDQYFDSSDLALANYFMSQVLRRFVDHYAKRRKVKYSAKETDALLDVLASWELSRTQNEVQLWETPPNTSR